MFFQGFFVISSESFESFKNSGDRSGLFAKIAPISVCQSRIIRTPPKRRYFRALCRIRLSPYIQYEQSRLRQKSSKIATFWLPASIAAHLSLKTRRKTEVRIILGWHTDIPDAYAVFSIIMQKSAGKSKPKINSRKKIKQKNN